MSQPMRDTSSICTPRQSKDIKPLIVLLGLLALLMIGWFEFAFFTKLRSDREVLRSVIAGSTRSTIEAEYGKPRFQSTPGSSLADAGWNGGEKETISPLGMSVYDASIFAFIICEFDDQDRLLRAWIWNK